MNGSNFITMDSTRDVVSVIIPVYKAERFLDECVDSVVRQTYKDLQIILIDDASPDSCPQMCDAWAEKDDRITVLHIHGGGASAARNAGLERATGTYVMFVDSDDLLELNAVEYALNALHNGYDMAIFGKRFIDEDGSDIRVSAIQQSLGIRYSEKDAVDYYVALAHLLKSDYLNPPWGKLFSRDLIGDARFSPDMTYEEDLDFNLQLLKRYPNVFAGTEPIYRYRHMNSGLASIFSEQKIDSVITASKEKLDYFRPYLADDRVSADLSLHLANDIGWVISPVCQSDQLTAEQKTNLIRRMLANQEILKLVRKGLHHAWLSRTLKFVMMLNIAWLWKMYVCRSGRENNE